MVRNLDPAALMGILDVSPDEIYVTDAHGITLWVNRTCERFYGVPAGYLIGRNVRELEAEGIFSPSLTLRVLESGRKVTALQATRNGRQLLVTSVPVRGPNGEVAYVVSNSRDVTEVMVLSERLTDAEELLRRYRDEVERLCSVLHERGAGPLLTPSGAMNEIMRTVMQVARVDTTVLVTGETGVGKTVLARHIHELSRRRDGPFVDLNCAAIPETLLESELFGYEKGAFTGARREGKAGMVSLAEGGTLFLDEISEVPLPLQSKLLHLVQERRYYRVGGTRPVTANIRIVAATNRDLEEMVRQGKFRRDLYYRLNVVPIRVPPLRERPEDIEPLLDHFLASFSVRYGVHREITPAARRALLRYDWPGNIRELENLVERLVVTARQEEIGLEDLPPEIARFASDRTTRAAAEGPGHSDGLLGTAPPARLTPAFSLTSYLEHLERELLIRARKEHRSSRKLAQALGISQSSVVRKLRKYGLSS